MIFTDHTEHNYKTINYVFSQIAFSNCSQSFQTCLGYRKQDEEHIFIPILEAQTCLNHDIC